jgi:hypothetical protein
MLVSASIFMWCIVPGQGHAELPMGTFAACGEIDRPDLCPDDLEEEWPYISYIPAHVRETIIESELELGSGMWVDRAWRMTTGRTDVVLAVADSGIDWSDRSLRYKFALNAAELPLPWDEDGVEYDSHDANEDGVVNIADYASDPRIDIEAGVDDADDKLDPSDLIYTFSDGVDDDENGYPDDICGWDFFGRDNDAFHTYTGHDYGKHGNGVARKMASEGNDDDGKIGMCPNCMVLPIRVGDTFITDGTRVAESIVFAADSGAVGMTLAIGALTNPDSAVAAARYAYDQGLTLVGAAGDENAYHRNFPAMMADILYVHSIRHDSLDEDARITSYFNTWNCNNYGARMDVVAPASECATGAVANITGMVGLLHSAARDAGLELTTGEVRQIINQTADDVAKPEAEREISNAYPSEVGWDPFYGYGRVNAARAVEAVLAGEIPPAVRVTAPGWFEPLDPVASPVIPLVVSIDAARTTGFSWTVEMGQGDAPRSWTSVASGSGADRFEGTLTELDLSELPWYPTDAPLVSEGIMERMDRVNMNQVTVRVRVTDADGLVAEERRTVLLEADPDRLSGFPKSLGSSAESSPVLADLDGDGVLEIVIAGADGRVHALRGDGSELAGWPVELDEVFDAHVESAAFVSGEVPVPLEGVIASSAVADIDGDGAPEVVVASLVGGVFAWNADGTPVDGWPVDMLGRQPEEFDSNNTYDRGFMGAPALYDLNDDGAAEVIALGMDSRLYVWHGDGTDHAGYPVDVCHPMVCGIAERRIINSPAVGDIDGDGDPDIVFGSNEAPNDGRLTVTHAYDARTGTPLQGWPITVPGFINEAVLLPLLGEGHPGSVALADLDDDGDLEMLNPVMFGTTGIMDHTGEVIWELSYFGEDYGHATGVDINLSPAIVQFATNPAWGDLDADGRPDPILGGASTLALLALATTEWRDFQQPLAAWSSASGNFLPGFPRQLEDLQFLLAPAVADLNGDGHNESVYGSAGGVLHAWNALGTAPVGWPKNAGQWILGSPAIGDVDGDGYLDVVVSTREGYVFAWGTRGPADQQVEWASQFHDAANTGNYEVDIPVQAGPPPSVAAAPAGKNTGCCKDDGTSGSGLFVLLPLGLLGWRRRRR